MWKRDFPPIAGPPPYEPDPVVEAYKKDVDRTLIRARLARTVEERLRDLTAMQRFAARWRGAAWRAQDTPGRSESPPEGT